MWNRLSYGNLAASGALVLSAAFFPAKSHSTPVEPIRVKWLIAHEPADVFRRSAKVFAQKLSEMSHGKMQLDILTPTDLGAKRGLSTQRIIQLLATNEVQLSQTVTTGLGTVDSQFMVFDLPFLFRDHEHARHVLDGSIGQNLLAGLDKVGVHGLAFTYSGGFRVVPSTDRAIRTADDFKGLKVGTTVSPVAAESLRLLGAQPQEIKSEHEDSEAMDNHRINAVESTYVRVDSMMGKNAKFINETHHSLFLTTILASPAFFKSLSLENQESLQKAANEAAQIERQDSISDGEKARDRYAKNGVQIITMTPAARKDLEARLSAVYPKFEKQIGADLIHSIQASR